MNNVSINKMSKKAKKEYYAKQRGVWFIDPRTRTTKKPTYTRKKKHKEKYDE